MSDQYPPELKEFNKKNMIHAFLVFIVPASAGCIAFYRQESALASDDIQRYLMITVWVGIPLFILTVLYKSLLARPSCPDCRSKTVQQETIDIDGASWRIVCCNECLKRYRIHGLSSGY